MRYINILYAFTFSSFLIGLIGDFITTIIWWNRIHPWFSHGVDEAKTIYQCLIACWVLSLIDIIFFVFLFISFMFFKSFFNYILKKKFLLITFIFILECISILSIISGVYTSRYALRNPSEKNNDDQKCAKYKWKGYIGSTMWVYNHQDKYEEYRIFFEKLFDYKNHSEGYLCRDVGVPTLFFSLVQCGAMVLSIITLIIFFIDTINNNEYYSENETLTLNHEP